MKSSDADGQLSSNASGFELAGKPSGNFSLKLWGRFPPSWIGGLSSGLSRSGISIISGSAKKAETVWQAEFEIMTPHFSADPNSIDYLAIAQDSSDVTVPVDIALDEFVLDDDLRKYDGAIYLAVRAKDQIGFLAALLSRCSFYTLFPETMLIETLGSKIFDRFWIKGLSGQAPSKAAINLLRKKLEGYAG
jgi:hypothetical protein